MKDFSVTLPFSTAFSAPLNMGVMSHLTEHVLCWIFITKSTLQLEFEIEQFMTKRKSCVSGFDMG